MPDSDICLSSLSLAFSCVTLCDYGQVRFSSVSKSVEWVCKVGGGGSGRDAWCFKGRLFSTLLMQHPSLFTGPSRPFCWPYLFLFFKLHLGVLSVTIYPVKWESCWVACLHLLVSSWAPLPPVWSISTSLWEFLQVRTTVPLVSPHPIQGLSTTSTEQWFINYSLC